MHLYYPQSGHCVKGKRAEKLDEKTHLKPEQYKDDVSSLMSMSNVALTVTF